MPIHDIVDYGAANWPQRPAVVFEDRATLSPSWRRNQTRLASGLRAITEPGDRVAMLARNIPVSSSGGQNITRPRSSESSASSRESRRSVVGGTDDVYGERVVAFVVRAADRELSAEEIAAHCREHLAGEKKPSQVVFVDDLPKTITGKIKKQDLRALLGPGA